MFGDEMWVELVDSFENVLPYSSLYWYKSRYFTNQLFFKEPLSFSIFSVLTYSSNLELANEYVYGNYNNDTVHKYHDEVEKAVADLLASKLKEYWLKDI